MSNLAYIPNDYARGYVASLSDSRKGVHVPLSFIDLCNGNLHDAMLFSQIMYWHEPSKETGETRLKKLDDDGYLWLYKNHSDWYKECRIKTQTVRKCLERLKKSGLIKYKLSGAEGNATPHIRIDWDVFEQKMKELESPKAKKPKKSKIIPMPEAPATVEHTPVTTEQGGLLQQDTPLLQEVKSNTENTTENTRKDISAPIVTDISAVHPKLSSEDHAMFMDILHKQLKLPNGVGWDVYHQLRGTVKDKTSKRYKHGEMFRVTPVSVAELKAYVPFYRTKVTDTSIPIPTSADGLETWFSKLRDERAEQRKQIETQKRNVKRPLNYDELEKESA